uniref:Peptidase S74 domain-containing protein n=1 Tax=Panagrellus redivivus TaxID=6233 RepID=A0A7E4VYG4_PANRE
MSYLEYFGKPASNPAQFEQPDSDATWQRNGQLLSFNGPVAIGGDRIIDNAQLSVMGNIVSTGSHTRPCDRRVKDNIIDVDKQEAMARLSQFRIVEFDYKKEIANEWGLDEDSRHRVGVVAQELAQVLPDAVRDNGDFLTVDDNRIFYETVAAAQELYRLTGNLECKIDQVEKISAKLARFSKDRHKLGLSEFSLFKRVEDSATLSGSTPSLVSTTTTCTERSTKNKQRRCRSNCARSDQTLCTSRVTQGTIVTLVVIMALCLLAMCTLYVLDWYNRTYVYSPHIPHITPSTNSQDIGHLIEQKYRLPLAWIPPTQPFAPILASMCDLMYQCPQYCCATTHKYGGTDGSMPALDGFVPLKSSTMKPAVLKTTYSPPSPFKSKTVIEILNLNVSIDQRYCVEKSCSPVKGRYNLYVPVSPFMPTIPLHIRFTVGDDKYVDNCGSLRDFAHKNCSFDFDTENHPTSYMMGENIFELSVGNFAQSAYRFRVGFTTESCNMSEDQQGRSFDEYNIIFYRKCGLNGTIA